MILEPNPAVSAVLEYLLAREGFRVEVHVEALPAPPVPALLLVAARDGLHVLESRDAAATLANLGNLSSDPRVSPEDFSGTTGIRAFVPKPFGSEDVLRVVRAVSGSDGRMRDRPRTV